MADNIRVIKVHISLCPECFHIPLLQTTFENIVNNFEIDHNEQFLHLSQCFQLYAIIILSFTEIFSYFCLYVFCCRVVVCGKWFNVIQFKISLSHDMIDKHRQVSDYDLVLTCHQNIEFIQKRTSVEFFLYIYDAYHYKCQWGI